MLTIKQIEAFYWSVKLGTFTAAADRLHTTQSAISKRIHGLENQFDVVLFQRSSKRLALTDRGQTIYEIAKDMLKHRDALLLQLRGNSTMHGLLRIGVTEMTAMTWLSTLIHHTRKRYPGLEMVPRLDLSGRLQRQLLEGELDLAFLSEQYLHPDLEALPLELIDFAWMGSPDLHDEHKRFGAKEISELAILSQSSESVLSTLSTDWLQNRPSHALTLAIDNLIAIAGLAVAGLGVACLPKGYFSSYVEDRRLIVLRTEEQAPSVQYYALFRRELGTDLTKTVAELAQECCDFCVKAN